MNTNPENHSSEIEASTLPGITRRSFIKRTTASAVVVALALHSFRSEAAAIVGSMPLQLGITISIPADSFGDDEEPIAEVVAPSVGPRGSSSEEQGQAIGAAIAAIANSGGNSNIDVQPIFADDPNAHIVSIPLQITISPDIAPPAVHANHDPEGNVVSVTIRVISETIFITIIWAQVVE